MSLTDAARLANDDGLAPAERLVLETILAEPSRVAFGTVAELATRSGTSGPTVMRVARKLGFDGYRSLQAAAQAELTGGLAPAAERIRRTTPAGDDPLARAVLAEVTNVEATLRGADPAAFTTAVRLLADRKRSVLVLAGDAERGIAAVAADQLGQLREGVEVLDGTPTRVAARVGLAGGADVVLAVDVRRYDTWVLGALVGLRDAGAAVVAVTDSAVSPLATGAAASFAVRAEGTGPFDSHVGTLALLHAIVAGVADRLRGSATDRLDRIEAAWSATGALS